MELSYTPLWKSVFTKCTDVNSDGIWCCGGVKRGNVMKAQARFILAEFLSNPQATTKLSEEMLLKDKEPSVE